MPRGDEMQEMQLLDVERRLERIERLLRAAADEARSARTDLGHPHGPVNAGPCLVADAINGIPPRSVPRFRERGAALGGG
jgi:hypothetical protein